MVFCRIVVNLSAALLNTAQKLLAGEKGVSSHVITVNVTSPGTPDLTLVDLPGLTELGGDSSEKVRQAEYH